MTTNRKKYLSASLILAAGLPAFPQTAPDRTTALKITIRIFDKVRISPSSLANAEMEASRIFQKAGLQTQWLHCLPSLTKAQIDTACDEPHSATDLDLRISTRSEARRSGAGRAWLGYAFPLRERNHASILYEHVRELAQDSQDRPSVAAILGHVMTHEIGHLLFRSTTHSLMGIMRARWNREDLDCAGRGVLLFTPEEAVSLRKEVQRRIDSTPHP
jgi:hypothetical protein